MKPQRILAIGAIAGGGMRLLEPFLHFHLGAQGLQVAYLAIDLLLILGLAGFYLGLRDRLSKLGISGIGIAILGLLCIRSGAIIGTHLYPLGEALTVFGTGFLGLDMLLRKAPSRIASVLFVLALAIGLASLIPQIAMPAAFAAGIAFGLGFALEGFALL